MKKNFRLINLKALGIIFLGMIIGFLVGTYIRILENEAKAKEVKVQAYVPLTKENCIVSIKQCSCPFEIK